MTSDAGVILLSQKGDYPPAHHLNVNVLLSNVTFFVIIAVLDLSLAINVCVNGSCLYIYICSFITHLYFTIQYYVSAPGLPFTPGLLHESVGQDRTSSCSSVYFYFVFPLNFLFDST